MSHWQVFLYGALIGLFVGILAVGIMMVPIYFPRTIMGIALFSGVVFVAADIYFFGWRGK